MEIDDESQRTYNKVNQIKFKTWLLKSSLCNHSDAFILVKRTITVAEETGATPNNDNKKVIIQNCSLFTNSISRINNTQVHDAHDIDVVVPKYSLIEYSDNYSKTFQIYSNFVGMNRVLADNTKRQKNNRLNRQQWFKQSWNKISK